MIMVMMILLPLTRHMFSPLAVIMFMIIIMCSSNTVKSEQEATSMIEMLRMESDVCAMSTRPISCPVNCFTTDPVCGENGVTYWCGCGDAECAGTRVAKLGFCETGNNGGGPSLSCQALLLVHMVWLIVLGVFVLLDLF